MKLKTHQQYLLILFFNFWIFIIIKENFNNQVQSLLLFLVYKKRKKEEKNKFIKFICQLSVEDMKIAIKILKELIYFIKRGRKK